MQGVPHKKERILWGTSFDMFSQYPSFQYLLAIPEVEGSTKTVVLFMASGCLP